MTFNEPFRSRYHFTPPQAWMNDPNGLVYYDGEYHLFYQHHPESTEWGPMHWGHAVSVDLVNWQHLPIALHPDSIGMIFSGSAIIDWKDTSGFGEQAMVAAFTHHVKGRQMQSLAYSTDRGRTWTKYAGNPVIESLDGIKDFRDPKAFWYDTANTNGHWVMLIAAGNSILFYTSSDLKHWESVSSFEFGSGAVTGVWETPELFELQIDDSGQTRWVLVAAVQTGAPAGGPGVVYFVGDFDGTSFTCENSQEAVYWVDYGADFYAPQSWNDVPEGRRIWIAWMNNWQYAQDIPTSTWRGALTFPRELALSQTFNGIRLRQEPISELQSLRRQYWTWQDVVISSGSNLLAGVTSETLEIVAEWQIDKSQDANQFGLRISYAPEQFTTIGYAIKDSSLFIDRSQSGEIDFNSNFPSVHRAPLEPVDGGIHLHILIDRSSVEIFANRGLTVFTERVFPDGDMVGLEFFIDCGQILLKSLEVYQLAAATFDDMTYSESVL